MTNKELKIQYKKILLGLIVGGLVVLELGLIAWQIIALNQKSCYNLETTRSENNLI